MIPYITKGDLTRLPEKRQKKICGCTPKCKEFYTFTAEEDFILCSTDTKEFGFEILEQLGLVTEKRAFPKSQFGWTTEQERFAIKYLQEEDCYQENGNIKYGVYAMIGEMIGKSRSAVKDKVNHLRKAGRI